MVNAVFIVTMPNLEGWGITPFITKFYVVVSLTYKTFHLAGLIHALSKGSGVKLVLLNLSFSP
jgi:hypothetical protein